MPEKRHCPVPRRQNNPKTIQHIITHPVWFKPPIHQTGNCANIQSFKSTNRTHPHCPSYQHTVSNPQPYTLPNPQIHTLQFANIHAPQSTQPHTPCKNINPGHSKATVLPVLPIPMHPQNGQTQQLRTKNHPTTNETRKCEHDHSNVRIPLHQRGGPKTNPHTHHG